MGIEFTFDRVFGAVLPPVLLVIFELYFLLWLPRERVKARIYKTLFFCSAGVYPNNFISISLLGREYETFKQNLRWDEREKFYGLLESMKNNSATKNYIRHVSNFFLPSFWYIHSSHEFQFLLGARLKDRFWQHSHLKFFDKGDWWGRYESDLSRRAKEQWYAKFFYDTKLEEKKEE